MTSTDMPNWCCSYNHVFCNPFRLGVMIDVCLREQTLDTKTDLVGVGHTVTSGVSPAGAGDHSSTTRIPHPKYVQRLRV